MKLTNRKRGRKVRFARNTAKGAKKAAKGTAVYKVGKGVAKRTPIVRRLPIVAAIGLAGLLAARAARGFGGQSTPAPAP